MRDTLGFNDEVEFILDSEEQSSVVLNVEPKNWNDDQKSYEVDKDFKMVMRKINTKLEITKNGYDYLYGSTLAFGLKPKVSITKRGKDVTDLHEEFRTLYFSFLDMEKLKIDPKRKIAEVTFTQGGLFDELKARYSDKYNLVSNTSADGETISDLSVIKEQAVDREIFRRSIGKTEKGIKVKPGLSGQNRDNSTALILEVNPNSDIDYIKSVFKGTEDVPYEPTGPYADGQIGSIIFTRSDRLRRRKLNGPVKVTITDGGHEFLRFEYIKYKFNAQSNKYEYIDGSRQTLAQINNPSSNSILQYDFNDFIVELEQDEAATFVFYGRSADNTFFESKGIEYVYEDADITITEDDSFPSTEALDILPYEMVDRLLEKITGEKGLLKSSLLGREDLGYDKDGAWAYLAVSSGFWARGFGLEDLQEKQFTIALKDALESFYTIAPIVMGIQKINGKEFFRLEKYEYTFQNFVGVRFGRTIDGDFRHTQASEPKITILSGDLFTGVKMGFEKGGNDYEEISGLSSPHGQSEFNTSYKGSKSNVYTKVSKIRGDVEGWSLARRKQATEFPDEDTSYDQDLFFRHLKRVGAQYFLRLWQDDFLEEPKGEDVYSPETMGNLLLTPFQCAIRHGKIIATSVYKEPFSKFTFISSNAFSSFSLTSLPGVEIQENGSVENQDLGKPFTSEYKLEFEAKAYQEVIDQIEGHTNFNGISTSNTNGIVEVKLDGILFTGKLLKSEINGSGKHEIALLP